MAVKRRTWVVGAAVLLIGIVGFLVYVVLAQNYEAAKEWNEKHGDGPYDFSRPRPSSE